MDLRFAECDLVVEISLTADIDHLSFLVQDLQIDHERIAAPQICDLARSMLHTAASSSSSRH